MTGRTNDVTGVSSPIVILHRVCCRSRRRELKRFGRGSRRGAKSRLLRGTVATKELFIRDWHDYGPPASLFLYDSCHNRR